MRVAIVGSGVSGLSAYWLLKHHSEHEVNMYEKNAFAGGHAHSVEFRRDGKQPCFVDTGFTSFNPGASPNLLHFLKLLGVPLVRADRSLSVSHDGEQPSKLGGVLQGVAKIFNPRSWRTTFDIARFNHFALDLLLEPQSADDQLTVAQYLAREGYSRAFFDEHLLPLISILWLVPDDHTALCMPAAVVIAVLADNGLLQWSGSGSGSKNWMSVAGGAKTYVDTIIASIPPENLHLNTDIVAIQTIDWGVKLVEAGGREHVYDHVILATPSNASLEMLHRGGWASQEEQQVLRAVKWTRIESEVHWDDKGIVGSAALNYATSPAPPAYDESAPARTQQVSLTLDMNRIQRLSPAAHGPVRVTLNPPWPADTDLASASALLAPQRCAYEVPFLVSTSGAALAHLPSIQGTRRISYTGAWTRRGRHEDGFASAMALVTSPLFNAVAPFAFEDTVDESVTTRIVGDTEGDSGAGHPANETHVIVRTKPAAAWVRGAALARAAIASAEWTRRSVAPLWRWVAWPVVIALALVRVSARIGGWRRIEMLMLDLRAGWRG